MNRTIRRLLILTAAGTLGALTAAGWYGLYHAAPYAILVPYRPPLTDPVYTITPASLGLQYSAFEVDIADSIRLQAWFLPADSARGTIVVLHGIGSLKEHMLGTAAEFVGAGYNVVLYDARAHGRSTGRYCTYGYYEKHDVSRVLDEAVRLFRLSGSYGVLGASLGGAVALQAMAVDRRFACGVVESAFASLDEIVYEYQRWMVGIPFRFVAREALQQACALADFRASEVRPEFAASQIHRPVLLAHGEADERIAISHGRRIFRALASPHKQWIGIPGAGHNGLSEHGGSAYREARLAFFRQWL